MIKRSRATLTSAELARLAAILHKDKGGFSPDKARDLVIIEWLLKDDPGPFLAAIAAGENVGPDVLPLIADMLKGERRRGPPHRAGLAWRDIVVALVYEKHCASVGSEVAFEETADSIAVHEKQRTISA